MKLTSNGGHTKCMKHFVQKAEGKRLLKRCTSRWKTETKVDLNALKRQGRFGLKVVRVGLPYVSFLLL
jgi:hypothetical protein